MKRLVFLVLAAWALAATPSLVPSSAAVAAEASPEATVRAFHDVLLDLVREGSTASIEQRYERLAAAVRKAFDMQLMARIAGGAAWQKAGPAEREKLEAALHRFSAALYASRFNEAQGMQVEHVGVTDGPGTTKLVNTRLIFPEREAVKVTYVVRQQQGTGGWRIVDVLLDGGISQLAQRRSEYHNIAANEGAPGLVQALNAKADQLLAQR